MNLISHRGNLNGPQKESENTIDSILTALKSGFGVEIDLRDSMGEIAISHDPVVMINHSVKFGELIHCLKSNSFSNVFALNIKSDGLLGLFPFENMREIQNYFFFDMSYPEQLKFEKKMLPIARRFSEYENIDLISLEKKENTWVWLDSFSSDWWIDTVDFSKFSENIKFVIVSPELHGRSPIDVWKWFAEKSMHLNRVWLCTDYPLKILGEYGAEIDKF